MSTFVKEGIREKGKNPTVNLKNPPDNATAEQAKHILCSHRLTAWVFGPGFTSGVEVLFPRATSSETELSWVLLRKSTSSSAFVSGISRESKVVTKCIWKIDSLGLSVYTTCSRFHAFCLPFFFFLALNSKYCLGAGVISGSVLSPDHRVVWFSPASVWVCS